RGSRSPRASYHRFAVRGDATTIARRPSSSHCTQRESWLTTRISPIASGAFSPAALGSLAHVPRPAVAYAGDMRSDGADRTVTHRDGRDTTVDAYRQR